MVGRLIIAWSVTEVINIQGIKAIEFVQMRLMQDGKIVDLPPCGRYAWTSAF